MRFAYYNKQKLCALFVSSCILFSLTGCGEKAYTPDITVTEADNSTLDSFTKDMVETPVNSSIDEDVISYFEEIEQTVGSILESETAQTVKQTGRKFFITTVDFLFYSGEIKGHTFEELTESGKQKVLQIWNSIDSKIEKKYPNYKENLLDKGDQLLDTISSLLKKGAENIDAFSRETLGEDTYQEVKDVIKDIHERDKENINTAKEFILEQDITQKAIEKGSEILDKGSEVLEEGKQKVKSWYENYR